MNEEGQRLLDGVGHVNGGAVESTPSLGSFGTSWLSLSSKEGGAFADRDRKVEEGVAPASRKVRTESGNDLLVLITNQRAKVR